MKKCLKRKLGAAASNITELIMWNFLLFSPFRCNVKLTVLASVHSPKTGIWSKLSGTEMLQHIALTSGNVCSWVVFSRLRYPRVCLEWTVSTCSGCSRGFQLLCCCCWCCWAQIWWTWELCSPLHPQTCHSCWGGCTHTKITFVFF